MSAKTGDALANMILCTRKSTLLAERRMRSASVSPNGGPKSVGEAPSNSDCSCMFVQDYEIESATEMPTFSVKYS